MWKIISIKIVKASPIGLKPILLSPLSSLLSPLFSIYFSYSRMYGSHQTLAVILSFFVLPLDRLLPLLSSLLTWYQSGTEEEIDLFCERNLSLPAGGSLPMSYLPYRAARGPAVIPRQVQTVFRPDGISPSRRYFAVVPTVVRRCSAPPPPRRRCSASPKRRRPEVIPPLRRRPSVALRFRHCSAPSRRHCSASPRRGCSALFRAA